MTTIEMEAILALRFALLNFLVVPGFPNPSPSFADYANFFSIFYGNKGDSPAQHLMKFHWCIKRLNIDHEDSLMKLFVYSLNGDARRSY